MDKTTHQIPGQTADTLVAFVELRPMTGQKVMEDFQPDVVIRYHDLILEISNTVSPELLKYLGGLLHAQ